MIRFFDTSAFVKRYVGEPGSTMVRAALRNHAVVVARVTLAEAAAAVARAARDGVVTEKQRDVILARLPEDFAKLQVVEVRPALVVMVPADASASSPSNSSYCPPTSDPASAAITLGTSSAISPASMPRFIPTRARHASPAIA